MLKEESKKKMNVSVIGLGKLGACIAATIAHRGFNVIGVDVKEDTVRKINSGEPPVCEPGLPEMIFTVKSRLKATTSIEEAIKNTELSFIITPTPSKKDGRFSLKFVKKVITGIGKALKNKDNYHLIVIISTIMPGSMESKIIPILEETSGKKNGKDFGVCYSPTLIALGSVIKNLLEPDLIILGEGDKRAGNLLLDFFQNYIQNHAPVFRMNLINAEISKIALNAYITTKISFVNTLAELCEQLPKADVDVVTETIGSDPRIGRKYFKGGLSFGGPCFPRDTHCFATLLRQVNVEPYQIEATEIRNNLVIDRIVNLIEKGLNQLNLSEKATIAIFGLTYKPGTVYMGASPSVSIIESLLKKDVKIIVHDPLALEAAREILTSKVQYSNNIEECIKKADLVVFTDQDKEYLKLKPSSFTPDLKKRVIVDIWRNFKFLEDEKGVYYIPIGKNI